MNHIVESILEQVGGKVVYVVERKNLGNLPKATMIEKVFRKLEDAQIWVVEQKFDMLVPMLEHYVAQNKIHGQFKTSFFYNLIKDCHIQFDQDGFIDFHKITYEAKSMAVHRMAGLEGIIVLETWLIKEMLLE